MVTFVHLSRLHVGRAVDCLGIKLLVFFCAIILALLETVLPVARFVAFAIFIVFAVATALLQAFQDRASGFSDGIRTTPATDLAIRMSRLSVVIVLFILQVIVFLFAAKLVSVFA